jgi:hypothetical protein
MRTPRPPSLQIGRYRGTASELLTMTMQLALIGPVAIIVLVALAAMALRRVRDKQPPSIADSYDELCPELSQIVARRLDEPTYTNGLRSGEELDEHGEVGAESDPVGATNAGANIALDRLLEPPEWPTTSRRGSHDGRESATHSRSSPLA